jgi:hypothetical protein
LDTSVPKDKKRYSVKLDELNLKPSCHVPFLNAELSDGKYLLVKRLSKQGDKIYEGVSIESFSKIPQARPKTS